MNTQQFLAQNQAPGFSPPPYLSRILPANIAYAYHVAPLSLHNETLLIASDGTLSPTQKQALAQQLRRPIRVMELIWTQVKRYQRICYGDAEPRPPCPPGRKLLDKLSLTFSQLSSLDLPENARLTEGKPSEWLYRGWINPAQWGQLMGLCYFLPHVIDAPPSPINALPAFLSHDAGDYRVKKAFVPLWWAGDSLFVGISAVDQIDAVKAWLGSWGLRVNVLLIPPTLKSDLQQLASQRALFADQVSDFQIARRLVEENLLTNQSLNAARTLKRSAGVAIQSALLDQFPELADAWLDAKAWLMDTQAIYEEDLPANFTDTLRANFQRLPQTLCRLLHVLPLNFAAGVLIVGMADIHPGLVAILKQVSRTDVEPRLMDLDVIERCLREADQKTEPRLAVGVGLLDARQLILAMDLIQPDQLNRMEADPAQDVPSYLNQLLAEGLLNEADLSQLMALLYDLPQLSLERFQIDSDLIADFSQTFLRDNHLLPLLKFDQHLLVALSNPKDDRRLKAMEADTGLSLWPVLVPRTPLEMAINRTVNIQDIQESTDCLNESITFLIEKGLISEEDRQDIVRAVVQEGQHFDRAVNKHREQPAQDLYPLFADFREAPFIALAPTTETRQVVDPIGNRVEQTRLQDPVDAETAHQLDYETALRLRALPVKTLPDGVQVAFATPLYDQARAHLERLLQTKVHPCITPRADLENAIDRVLGRTNIGALLINAGLVTRGQLNDALNLAKNTGSRIGQALIHRGYISEDQLYSLLSKQANLPLFDLSYVDLSEEVTKILTPDEEWEHGILPLSQDEDTLIVGVIDPINQEPIDFIKAKTDVTIRPVLITENDFENALERLHHQHYTTQSVARLLSREPENSAARVVTTPQIIVLIACVLLSIGLGIWNFQNFLIGVNAIFTIIYILMIFYKFVLIANAIGTDLEVPVSAEEIDALRDETLPVYTILIPVYKEASVLPKLLRAITRLDYPKIKLDVKVLLEEGDEETIQAFRQIDPPEYIQGLIVPSSHPKTKPKACNYGLIRARGEYVVIYDAEDKPEPDQLKKVIAAFQKISPDVICIQSKLNYFNRQQNLLTQWFSSEYSMWFDLFLPGLDARHAPIPLGGTSNHFKKFALIEAGAWDPHNVTEDADLGIRLYKLGYRTRIVDTTTYEEANSRVDNWIRQRSRWVKGYIQTWLVHMRRPIRLMREIGFMAFFSFQMVVGGNIFTVLMNPVYWLTTTLWFLFEVELIASIFPGIIYIFGAISLFFGNFTFTYINVAGAMKRGYYDMVKAALISPIYWGLMSIGGWKGFLQLITNPFYWEKTEHGLEGSEAHAEGELEA